jgi:hypothetical protein
MVSDYILSYKHVQYCIGNAVVHVRSGETTVKCRHSLQGFQQKWNSVCIGLRKQIINEREEKQHWTDGSGYQQSRDETVILR